jgi:hypothetical protein
MRAPTAPGPPSPEAGLRRPAQRALRWAADNRLVLGAGIAAALPVAIAVADALSNRWVPLRDDGIIVLRSWDVLTDESPLVGQYSQATLESVGNAYSPGPLLYWLLAVPVRLVGLDGVPLTVGLVNVLSIMGAVALARRRGGVALMLLTALAIVLTCRSFPETVLTTPFNPTLPILPCVLLFFLAWSLACGETRLLPVTALVASFVTQTHLSFVAPAAGVLAIGIGGLVDERRRARSLKGSGDDARPWVLAAAVVVAVCWTPPLVDLVVHNPSNAEVLVRTVLAERPKLGLDAGWKADVRAVGIPPWWLQTRVDALGRFLDVARAPGAASAVSFLAVLGGLLFVTLAALGRRRDVAAATALALVLVAAFAIVAGSTPAERVLTLGYTMQWGSPVGMFAWLALGFGTATLLARTRWRPPDALTVRGAGRALAWGALAVVTVAGAVAGIAQTSDRDRWLYSPARTAIVKLESELPAGRTVFLSQVPFEVQGAIAYALRRHGVRALVPPNYVEAMGSYYDVTNRRYDRTVVMKQGHRPAPRGGRILARIPIGDGSPPRTEAVFTLALGPPGVGPPRPG